MIVSATHAHAVRILGVADGWLISMLPSEAHSAGHSTFLAIALIFLLVSYL